MPDTHPARCIAQNKRNFFKTVENSEFYFLFILILKRINFKMLKNLKIVILAPLMFIVAYSLCLFYSFLSVLYVGVSFVTKYNTKFWIPKVRKHPPACLSNTEFGEHKYIRVNVSAKNIFNF